ncbi:ABC transporter ATP-binding protein [Paracoccus denitrificans]|nr:ABC transporter ATP-binding protein [Paracoccus denitrificans]UFS67211.1 ABC transporter ATP-binding protein [Paracoccus denitrificans]
MPEIILTNIDKNYGGAARNAVEGLNLRIEDGDFLCVLGPSGCGKSTTLRMIAGLEHPTAGSIRVGERVVDDVEGSVLVPAERRGMGLVFQNYALWPHLTIERNVAFGLELQRVAKADRQSRVDQVMETMGIAQYRDRYPSQLSGGQQQRVALARMLAVNPSVMLLDEPLSNLDSRLRLEMRAELKRIHESFRSTVVFVTHDQWEAMTLATRIAVMLDGRLQQVGTPTEIYDQPANRFVAEFLGNPPINMIELDAAEPLAAGAAEYLGRHGIADAGTLGIRPEALRLDAGAAAAGSEDWAVPAEVVAVLPTGGNWIVECMSAGRRLFAVTSVPPRACPGDRVTLLAAPDAIHVFDVEGKRMTLAPRSGFHTQK